MLKLLKMRNDKKFEKMFEISREEPAVPLKTPKKAVSTTNTPANRPAKLLDSNSKELAGQKSPRKGLKVPEGMTALAAQA